MTRRGLDALDWSDLNSEQQAYITAIAASLLPLSAEERDAWTLMLITRLNQIDLAQRAHGECHAWAH